MHGKPLTVSSGLRVGKIKNSQTGEWRPCIEHVESGLVIVLSDPKLKSALEREYYECAERNK